MKFAIALLALALVASASARSKAFRKQADADWLDKQRRVLRLYVGLGADVENQFNHAHKDFSFDKPEFYKKPEVFEKFLKVYKRGMLPRNEVYTMNCHKVRHDTFKLFDLFYFAKDFDTFYQIAEWARYELHPIQFSYAFTLAVYHRPDTKGIMVPPLYEIHPHYFVHSDIMHQAYHAKEHDIKYRKFELNNTGWEWSFHQTMMTTPVKASQRWRGDDYESHISYFREDADLANWYVKQMTHFATWLTEEKYPDVHYERRGEIYYIIHKWLLTRYNLERYANNLPYIAPFDYNKPIDGYNPHLVDFTGRSIVARPDHLVPNEVNSYDFWEVEQTERRIYDAIDMKLFFNRGNQSFVYLDDKNGLDYLGRSIFGARDAYNRDFYQPWFYQILHAVDNMVTFNNDRDYTIGTLGTFMTFTRDPAFWKVLATADEMFNTHFNHFHSYSKDELDFPGVKINSLEVDKMVTYFENFDFEITNGVPFSNRAERLDKKYMVSKFRMNHKPFNLKVSINSDKAQEAVVRIFIGPPRDQEFRPLNMNQMRHAFVHLDMFKTKLVAGENVIERASHDNPFFETTQFFRSYYERVNKSLETKEAFYFNEFPDCGAPQNLMLPRGSKSGKEYVLYAIVTPYEFTSEHLKQGEFGICGHIPFLDQHSLQFPFDRWAWDSHFTMDNMVFKPVTIYHKYEQDVNRAPQA